jgi:DnaJ-class molecular chaperone
MTDDLHKPEEYKCPLCDGSGMMSEEFSCSLCDGSGTVPRDIVEGWDAMKAPGYDGNGEPGPW